MKSNEKTLSVLFAGVSGSSRLFERLGAAEAVHAVDRCMKRIARGVEVFHGRIVNTTSDDLAAVFDNADDACQAAIAMQQRVADLPPVSGLQLAIRAGFHRGMVLEDRGVVLGACVTIAEGLAAIAKAGQILVSGETRANLSPAMQAMTRCLQEVSVKGLPDEQQVWEVAWLEPRTPARRVVVPPSPPPPPPESRTIPLPVVEPAQAKISRLGIRYGAYVKILDREKTSLLMGRDTECEIPVRDRRASRHHARVEWRDERFVLSDLSTNGTFVTIRGEPELFLRREDFVLRGSGIISFAASASSPDADIAEFEHL